MASNSSALKSLDSAVVSYCFDSTIYRAFIVRTVLTTLASSGFSRITWLALAIHNFARS
jgi:hypothetical protein